MFCVFMGLVFFWLGVRWVICFLWKLCWWWFCYLFCLEVVFYCGFCLMGLLGNSWLEWLFCNWIVLVGLLWLFFWWCCLDCLVFLFGSWFCYRCLLVWWSLVGFWYRSGIGGCCVGVVVIGGLCLYIGCLKWIFWLVGWIEWLLIFFECLLGLRYCW